MGSQLIVVTYIYYSSVMKNKVGGVFFVSKVRYFYLCTVVRIAVMLYAYCNIQRYAFPGQYSSLTSPHLSLGIFSINHISQIIMSLSI